MESSTLRQSGKKLRIVGQNFKLPEKQNSIRRQIRYHNGAKIPFIVIAPGCGTSHNGGLLAPETLHHRDDALLCTAYGMLIWAAPIPANRWHCSLWT